MAFGAPVRPRTVGALRAARDELLDPRDPR
jgi:hypothetical protein